jgi:putative ABC transport system permease protein
VHPRAGLRLATVEAVRSLARNKIRTGLAMLGIIVGVATVIWVVAIARAATEQVLADIDSLGDNLVWIEAGSRNAAGVRTGTHGMTTLQPGDAEAIRREVPLIAKVSENVDGRIQVVSDSGNWNTGFRGVSPEYLEIRRWTIARGAFFNDDDVAHARPVIVIGETVRRELFGERDPLGESLRISGSVFTVVGVLGAKGPSATGNDQDDTVMMPWTTAKRRILGRDMTWLDDILCSAVSTDQIRAAADQASELLRERHHIEPGTEDDFNIRHPEDLLKAKLSSAHTLSLLLAIIALLSLGIGGIGIMNVMLASVAQRRNEIGLRVALGATPGAIQLQFLSEAVVLTATSGALGVLLGASCATRVADVLGWAVETSPALDGAAFGFAVAVGVCFGFYPALRAARLDPIVALRME